MTEWFEGSGVQGLPRRHGAKAGAEGSEVRVLVPGMVLLAAAGADAQTCPSSAELTKDMTAAARGGAFSAPTTASKAGAPARRASSCAGDYIAREFERIGLRPAGEQGYLPEPAARVGAQPARCRRHGTQRHRRARRRDDSLKRRVDRHRRPLRPPWQRRPRFAHPGTPDSQRRRRQRVGRRRHAARGGTFGRGPAPGAKRALHRIHGRGSRPARLGVLRRRIRRLAPRRIVGDDQPRHGRTPRPGAAHHVRRGHRRGVEGGRRPCRRRAPA